MCFREIFGSSNLVIVTAGGALVYYGRCQANLDFLSIFSGISSQDCISLQLEEGKKLSEFASLLTVSYRLTTVQQRKFAGQLSPCDSAVLHLIRPQHVSPLQLV